MPAQILHTLFGETVIAAVGTRLSRDYTIQAQDRAVFALGCQGPDIFYHSQMTRPAALEYGTLLHRRGFGDFTAALLARALPDVYRKETELPPLGIYALGFMTHAMLDRLCHPYIVYKSSVIPHTDKAERFAQTFQKGTAHAFFERILDVLMLELLQGKSAAAWNQGVLVSVCADPPAGIKELLFHTLQAVFPERAGKDKKLSQRIDNVFADCAGFYCLTAPQFTYLKKSSSLRRMSLAHLYPERLPLDIDYLNLGHQRWFYPTEIGAGDYCSFPEIYGTAVQTAAEVFSSLLLPYFETGTFPLSAAQCLGNEGLSILDETGKPCAPSKTEALPLDAVLLHQRALRDSYT